MKKSSIMYLAVAACLLAVACKKEPEHAEGPMEAAGEEVDNTASDVKEGASEAAEDTGDAVEEAGDEASDATK
jgi:hypothetical protein